MPLNRVHTTLIRARLCVTIICMHIIDAPTALPLHRFNIQILSISIRLEQCCSSFATPPTGPGWCCIVAQRPNPVTSTFLASVPEFKHFLFSIDFPLPSFQECGEMLLNQANVPRGSTFCTETCNLSFPCFPHHAQLTQPLIVDLLFCSMRSIDHATHMCEQHNSSFP